MKRFLSIAIVFVFFGRAEGQKTKSQEKNARIAVAFTSPKDTGTFQVSLYRIFFYLYNPDENIDPITSGDSLIFLIKDISGPVYICFRKSADTNKKWSFISKPYLVEAGDDVAVKFENIGTTNILNRPIDKFVFNWTGRSSAKYTCLEELDQSVQSDHNQKFIDSDGQFLTNTSYDSNWIRARIILNRYKKSMSPDAFALLGLDFYANQEIKRLERLLSWHFTELEDEKRLKEIRINYNKLCSKNEPLASEFQKSISANYAPYIIDKVAIGRYKRGNSKTLRNNHHEDFFTSLKQSYKGELRDKLITLFAYNNVKSKEFQTYLEKAQAEVKSAYYQSQLAAFAENNAVGKPAFRFSLPDTTGNIVSLEQFRNKVVFIDFWYTGCGGCAQYYQGVVKDVKKHFKTNPEVSFITISIDTKRDRWMNAIYSNEYTSPDAINLYTGGEGSVHPIIKHYNVRFYPRPLLIDKNGNLFSNNNEELRRNGVKGLIEMIDKALKK